MLIVKKVTYKYRNLINEIDEININKKKIIKSYFIFDTQYTTNFLNKNISIKNYILYKEEKHMYNKVLSNYSNGIYELELNTNYNCNIIIYYSDNTIQIARYGTSDHACDTEEIIYYNNINDFLTIDEFKNTFILNNQEMNKILTDLDLKYLHFIDNILLSFNIEIFWNTHNYSIFKVICCIFLMIYAIILLLLIN